MNSPAALQRRREYAGPAVFSYGFRPFFFVAGLWAALTILLWLPQYFGQITLPTSFRPIDWHILYGYVAASIGGFLLTAIPNWPGRLPVNGWPLGALAFLKKQADANETVWIKEKARLQPEWNAFEADVGVSSRPYHQARSPLQVARSILSSTIRWCRRSDVLRF